MDVAWSDSRDPHRFEARIEPLGFFPPPAGAESFPLRLRLTNAGDTTWRSGPRGMRGTGSAGVQLLDETGAVAERDYLRIPLPKDVTPGETVEIEAVVPRGRTDRFAIDLVAEQICWFVSHGSAPLVFTDTSAPPRCPTVVRGTDLKRVWPEADRNPNTGLAWTYNDIVNLVAGVYVAQTVDRAGGFVASNNVDQVSVEINGQYGW